jgi:hypothetical protein
MGQGIGLSKGIEYAFNESAIAFSVGREAR